MVSKWSRYFFQVLLLVLPFLLPVFELHADNPTLLTAVSLLFAILVGFFIATTTSNYLRLQTLIADSNACLISIFNLVKIVDPDKKETVEQAIDDYMISSLDYEFLDFTYDTKQEFDKVIGVCNSVEPKSEKSVELISELHARMDDLLTNDQETALTAKTIVSPRHWFIITLLAVLLSVSLLSFRNGSILVSLFIGIMFVAIYHIMILIHEIDTNIFLSKQLSFRDPQQVFRGIGRLPYYPEYAIKKGYAKPDPGHYRIGIYTDRPRSLKKDIKIQG